MNVVAVAGKLESKGDASLGSKNEMFFNAVKPAFQRGAITRLNKTTQPFFITFANRTADIYGMGVDDEKGGFFSPPISRKVFESR